MASKALPLLNQNCWIVGGVGVVGRGVARSLLKAGATVIVNSRSQGRLKRFEADIKSEVDSDISDRLVMIKGSLLPGYAQKTVGSILRAMPLHHVVAHGALRFGGSPYVDETHSVSTAGGLLQLDPVSEFVPAASHLTALHFSAASALIPRVQFAASGQRSGLGTYTFITGSGDAGGSPTPGAPRVPPMAELNQYQVWGLASALRRQDFEKVNVRELRVQLDVNRPTEAREQEPREVPLSAQIGDLCAGMAAHPTEDIHQLFDVTSQEALSSLTSSKYSLDNEEERTILVESSISA